MNKLTIEDRASILHLLCEGIRIRAIARLTGVSKNTVAKLLIDAGKACFGYHDANVRDVKASRVQIDEVWSFNYTKQKDVADANSASPNASNTWTWTAFDADSKMILSYLVGGRDAECARWFIDDLAPRLANRVQLICDGQRVYLEAVEGAFGCDVDDADLLKLYGNEGGNGSEVRYSPAECTGIRKRRVEGNPDEAHVSTNYVERQNPTMRMHMRHCTRLSNAFSKKIESHAHAVALHMMYYNFVRIHKALRVTPAMAAGVTDRLWEIADIAMLVEQAEAKPRKRGPYKKKGQISI